MQKVKTEISQKIKVKWKKSKTIKVKWKKVKMDKSQNLRNPKYLPILSQMTVKSKMSKVKKSNRLQVKRIESQMQLVKRDKSQIGILAASLGYFSCKFQKSELV